jgi:hypothetical protein
MEPTYGDFVRRMRSGENWYQIYNTPGYAKIWDEHWKVLIFYSTDTTGPMDYDSEDEYDHSIPIN